MENVVKHIASLCASGKRTHNEDFVYPSELATSHNLPTVNQLSIVTDGIGGANKGDVAARIATESFAKYFAEYPPVLTIAQPYLDSALKFVENAFDEYIKLHPECWGMGTTVALLYADSDGINVIWAGNSRAYWFRKGERKYRTEDHTEVNQLVREGRISEQEAQNHSRRHSILRAIQGSSYPTQLDYYHIDWKQVEEGDYFLLCTDGVLEGVKENELGTLFGSGETAENISNELSHHCQVESNDNYGAVILQVGKKEVVEETRDLTDKVENTEAVTSENVFIPAVEPVLAETQEVKTPEVETPVAEVATPVVETPVIETPKVEVPKIETPQIEVPKVEVPKVEIPVGNNPKNTPSLHDILASDSKLAGNDTPEPNGAGTMSATMMGILVVALFALSAGLIYWYSARKKNDKFNEYITKAETNAGASQLDSALFYADAAYAEATKSDNKEKQTKASTLITDIKAKQKELELQAGLDEAMQYEKSPEYMDWIRARNIYKGLNTDGKYTAQLAAIEAKISQTKPEDAYKALMAEAKSLCEANNGPAAMELMADAEKLDVKNKAGDLARMRKDCGAGAANTVAANDTRNMPTNNNTKGSTSTAPKIVKPAAPKSNSSPEVVASRGGAGNMPNARVVTNGTATTTTNSNVEGKRLYDKAKKEGSTFLYSKAAAELGKAVTENKANGESYYLLAVMYNEGKGVSKDAATSLKYAKLSAESGYHNGESFYGKQLQKLGPNYAKEADKYLKRAQAAGVK